MQVFQPQTGLRVSTSLLETFFLQSDQASSHLAIKLRTVTHLDGFESRIQALETSTIINVPKRRATANSTKVQQKLSVIAYTWLMYNYISVGRL